MVSTGEAGVGVGGGGVMVGGGVYALGVCGGGGRIHIIFIICSYSWEYGILCISCSMPE